MITFQPALDLTAGIQDIMAYMIDPSADFLWESVSSTVTTEGVEESSRAPTRKE